MNLVRRISFNCRDVRGSSRSHAHLFGPSCWLGFDGALYILLLLALAFGLVGCNSTKLSGSDGDLSTISSPSGPVVRKIITDQVGILAMRAQGLAEVGIDLSATDTRPISMYWRGQSIPVWVDQELGELRFYAHASRSIYSRDDTYWLVQGEENASPDDAFWRMTEELPELSEAASAQALLNPDGLPAGTYAAAVHLEENIQYQPQVEQGDHWLWITLPAPQSHDFEVALPEVEPVAGAIRLAVWARTEGPGEIDHHLQISINDQMITEERWDGKGGHTITAQVPEGVWKFGKNMIRVTAPGDTGNAADVVVIDWMDIVFARKFQAENDRLSYISTGKPQPLQSFQPPIRGYDVSDPLRPVSLDTAMFAEDTFTGQLGHRYWLVGAKGGLAPDRVIPPDLSLDLRAETTGAEYIAVGQPELLAPLQPLLDFRSQNGFNVMAVPLQSVFDQFNGGMPEPEAIRSFLRYASQNWQQKPKYLLLVGDATYDPLGYQAPVEANRLPVFLVDTVFGGETASDVLFTQLDGDKIPDLAVGRIPAQSPEQISTFVAKTLAYEQQPVDAAWKHKVLAVADGQDATFKLDAQHFLDLFPTIARKELLASEAGATDINLQIIERINQGDGLVAYFGHGSVNMWGKDRLFSTEDVPRLENAGQYPVMINMTCLTGLFTHPKVESLAEAMLWQPGAGAVAVLAPTSLTLPFDQSFLSRPLVEALLGQPGITLGDALLHARQQISTDNTGSQDVMETFLLFGDPALRVPTY